VSPGSQILVGVDDREAGQAGSFWPRERIRRTSDAARLLATVGGLIAVAALSALVPGIGDVTLPALRGVPRTLLSVVNAIASFAVLVSMLALAVAALRRRRYSLVLALLACALGVALAAAALAARAAGWVGAVGATEESPVVPVVAGLAFVVGADARWSHRLRGLAYTALAASAGCALVLGSLTVPAAAVTVLLGVAAGLAVRVVAGVVPARPPEEVVRAVLARAGFAVTSLRPIEQVAGRARYAARDGRGELEITVVDPDRWGVVLARRLWRVVRFRTPAVGRPSLSLRGVLERQALVSGLAQSADVVVPPVVALLAAGRALVLVERPLAGRPLAAAKAGGDRPVSESLTSVFGTLRRLHDAGLAHGGLTAHAVVLLPGGTGLTDLRAAQPAASDLQRDLDVVAMLVVVAAEVGAAEAVAAWRAGYPTGSAERLRVAALLQPPALPPRLRRAVRGTGVLDDLRVVLAGPDAGPAVAAPRLERIRARTVVSVAGATVAALVLGTQLSEISLGSAIAEARLPWLGVALLGSALTYVGSALVLGAFSPVRLPLGRSSLVQLAASFVTLVTPPTVGHVGLNIRYLQRSGLPTATAVTTVGVSQVVTVAVTVALLFGCGWLSGVSPSRPALLPSGDVLAVLLVAGAVLGLVALVPASRRLVRRRAEPLIRRTVPQLVAAATDPRRLGSATLGVLLLNGGYVVALDASLRAFSASLALPTLVVVYLVASTVGSAAPTPGGLGAVEAALVGGLTATGVPVAAALTAVLAFRAATFWLPAPVGWVAFVALQRRERI
jgi:glycosyltransferase 2 family protein